jgi:integrase
MWERIAKSAALSNDVTPHVFRHSFASLAADLGFSEPSIAALIGHAGRSSTSRYIHTADSVLLAAADAVARRTSQLMGEITGAEVVTLKTASRQTYR